MWREAGIRGARGVRRKRIARRYIMSGISRKIVSGTRTAKMSVRGEGAGDARRWPNKYLTKSPGKLIPSLGRLLRGIPSAAAPSTSERRARTSPCRSILRFSSCDFATGSVQGARESRPGVRNRESRALKILERYRNPGFP